MAHPQTSWPERYYEEFDPERRRRLLDEAMEDLLLKYKVISQKEKTP